MQAVDGIRSDAHGGVKSKGNIRSPNIIINGFGDRYDVDAHCGKFSGSFLRSVSSDADDTIQSHFLNILKNQCRLVDIRDDASFFKRFLTRGTQNSATQIKQTGQ